MPYTIIHSKKPNDPRPWKIVNEQTGKVVGTSVTRSNAVGSIAHRTDAEKGHLTRVLTNKNAKGRNKIKTSKSKNDGSRIKKGFRRVGR